MILNSRFGFRSLQVVVILIAAWISAPAIAVGLRAGAAKVDISPTEFPTIVNGMFTERTASRVVDGLMVRALVLEKGSTRIALAMVDSCMVPREIIDAAKGQAARATGIPVDRILISSTHTHSAPSAMGCLGSRADPRYILSLAAAIARAIDEANRELEPALAGAAAFDATGFTHNRRWIRRLDRMEIDPFGKRTVRAHMHPGHMSPDVTGPSGPVDPAFTLLSLVRPDGSPIALLGNFSMHYYESEMMSSDYFGRWCWQVEQGLGDQRGRTDVPRKSADISLSKSHRPMVALMSQGTSGDLMWMDYSKPREQIGYDAYARALTERTLSTWAGIQHRADVPLSMQEERLTLRYRVADESRLAVSRDLVAKVGDRLPQTLPEIYAFEQLELKRRGSTELVLQALRIGDLGIAALPNEVFALTGLKLKAQSPLPLTMNVELANGAEGYIPPPEQHALGGYTTWAARTAGLETNAEPRIVSALLKLLEQVSGRPRRLAVDGESSWTRALRASHPGGYWNLAEQSAGALRNQIRGGKAVAELQGRYALYLDGVDQPVGSTRTNHAVHLADGGIQLTVPEAPQWTMSFWFWNGFPVDAAAETGELLRCGSGSEGCRIAIGGSREAAGKLVVSPGGSRMGQHSFGIREWHHLAVVGNRNEVRVFLDGIAELEFSAPSGIPPTVWRVGGSGASSPFQGKIDEMAWHPRSLTARELQVLVGSIPGH